MLISEKIYAYHLSPFHPLFLSPQCVVTLHMNQGSKIEPLGGRSEGFSNPYINCIKIWEHPNPN